MLKSNIDVFFCDVIYCFIEYSILRDVYEKNTIFLWLSFCDMTVPSKSTMPSL